MPLDLLVPPPLEAKSRIRVVAPSSPFDRTLLLAGVAHLGHRYRVEFDWSIFERHGFLAGSDERRLGELRSALADPGLAAVVAARGGYGLTRIAHELDYSALRRAPKWIIGFSDITALHVEAQRAGVASLHAHNAAGLGRGDARARAAWQLALEAPQRIRVLEGVPVVDGRVRGPLCGGNLTLLFTCAAAGRLRLPPGAILAIEDVTETSYRIDRMLSALRAAGHLREIAGVAVGMFTDCAPGVHGVPVESVLERELRGLGVPVLAGLPFGHSLPNEPLLLGAVAELDATAGQLVMGDLRG